MLIIGLTGSVATGKTTIASLLSKMRIPVFNSDEAVNFILDQDKKIIHQIRKKFFRKNYLFFTNNKKTSNNNVFLAIKLTIFYKNFPKYFYIFQSLYFFLLS